MLSDTQVRDILVNLGFLAKRDTGDSLCVEKAVRDLQTFYGLSTDGVVGNITQRTLLNRASCGCGLPDIGPQAQGQVCKWPTGHLRYFVKDIPSLADGHDPLEALDLADSWWNSCGADISITRVTSMQDDPDFIITTGRGKRAGFDGPMGTLAYAYMPCGNFQRPLSLVFDLDETWVLVPARGRIPMARTDFHEKGHIIGFPHVAPAQGKSAMNPTLQDFDGPTEIDRQNAIEKYGPAKTTPVPPTTPPTGGGKRTKLTLVGDFDVTVETIT